MRGSIRTWVVLGALTSAALLVPGCERRARVEPGTGGSGATDAGTGGAGYSVPQETGTQGQGVTGGSDEGEMLNTETETGGIRSPNVPEPRSDEEQLKR